MRDKPRTVTLGGARTVKMYWPASRSPPGTRCSALLPRLNAHRGAAESLGSQRHSYATLDPLKLQPLPVCTALNLKLRPGATVAWPISLAPMSEAVDTGLGVCGGEGVAA